MSTAEREPLFTSETPVWLDVLTDEQRRTMRIPEVAQWLLQAAHSRDGGEPGDVIAFVVPAGTGAATLRVICELMGIRETETPDQRASSPTDRPGEAA